MKRIGNLYTKICSIENLRLADKNASKGKSWQPGVIHHRLNQESNILLIHESLINKTYKTSPYITFKVYEPKERIVYRLPYDPDRIVHHAIMNVLEPIFVSTFISQTYSCIKGKGIRGGFEDLKRALKDVENTRYCLKLDIKKFYPSINHEVLKMILRRKIKDQDLLWLLDEIIDSAEGLPIGNYLSQYLANFYITGFDHWIKEVMGEPYYFRYADDIVILSPSKAHLHKLLAAIREYLSKELKLVVKDNYQVFPVEARGIDFLGFVFRHTHIRLRKRIKQNFARMLAKRRNKHSIAAYNGWLLPANTKQLRKKLLNENV